MTMYASKKSVMILYFNCARSLAPHLALVVVHHVEIGLCSSRGFCCTRGCTTCRSCIRRLSTCVLHAAVVVELCWCCSCARGSHTQELIHRVANLFLFPFILFKYILFFRLVLFWHMCTFLLMFWFCFLCLSQWPFLHMCTFLLMFWLCFLCWMSQWPFLRVSFSYNYNDNLVLFFQLWSNSFIFLCI